MTDHSITPPPELVQQWQEESLDDPTGAYTQVIANRAAQWGADQELEACCNWLPKLPPWSADDLRKHRRPKPPSLKEQALEALSEMEDECLMVTNSATIRRALEQIND